MAWAAPAGAAPGCPQHRTAALWGTQAPQAEVAAGIHSPGRCRIPAGLPARLRQPSRWQCQPAERAQSQRTACFSLKQTLIMETSTQHQLTTEPLICCQNCAYLFYSTLISYFSKFSSKQQPKRSLHAKPTSSLCGSTRTAGPGRNRSVTPKPAFFLPLLSNVMRLITGIIKISPI